jgi:phosphatidate cytidylyltransferase
VLRQRVLTAVVGVVALVIVVFLMPPRVALAFYAAAVLFAAWEWSALVRLKGSGARACYVAAIAVLMALASNYAVAPEPYRQLLIVTAGWWAIALLWLMFIPERVSRVAAGVAGALVLVPAWTALSQLQIRLDHGPELVFYVLCLVWAADIGAYFVGRRFGQRRLAPRVSPGKTWEGVAGGMAGAALIAAVGAQLFAVPMLAFIPLSVAVALASIVGDLTESMFKRAAGLKDSGNFIPGHGGLLDRIDSVTAAVPLFVLGLAILGEDVWSA